MSERRAYDKTTVMLSFSLSELSDTSLYIPYCERPLKTFTNMYAHIQWHLLDKIHLQSSAGMSFANQAAELQDSEIYNKFACICWLKNYPLDGVNIGFTPSRGLFNPEFQNQIRVPWVENLDSKILISKGRRGLGWYVGRFGGGRLQKCLWQMLRYRT